MAKYSYRCPDCKTEVILRQRVTQTKRKCSYCGTPITTAEIDRQAQEKIKEQIVGFLIFIGIVIIILRPQLLILPILIGIIWLGIKIGKNKKKKPPSIPAPQPKTCDSTPLSVPRVSPQLDRYIPSPSTQETKIHMPALTQPIDKVSKSQAIAIVNEQGKSKISAKNTVFSNINSAKNVYWFDIPVDRVSGKGDLNLLTYDRVHGKLYHLEVPHSHFSKNLSSFYIRQDKQAISLELDATIKNQFQDIRTGSKRLQFRGFLKGVHDCSNLSDSRGKEDDDSLETLLSNCYGEPVHIVGSRQDEDNAGRTRNMYILREIRRGYYLEMLIIYDEDDLADTSVSHRVLPSFLPLLEDKNERTWQKFTKKAKTKDWLAFDEIVLNTILFPSSHVFFAGAKEIGPDVADEALERFGCYYPDEDLLPVLIFENTDYQLRLFIPSSRGKFASECQVGDALSRTQSCWDSLKEAQEFLDQRLSYYIQEVGDNVDEILLDFKSLDDDGYDALESIVRTAEEYGEIDTDILDQLNEFDREEVESIILERYMMGLLPKLELSLSLQEIKIILKRSRYNKS